MGLGFLCSNVPFLFMLEKVAAYKSFEKHPMYSAFLTDAWLSKWFFSTTTLFSKGLFCGKRVSSLLQNWQIRFEVIHECLKSVRIWTALFYAPNRTLTRTTHPSITRGASLQLATAMHEPAQMLFVANQSYTQDIQSSLRPENKLQLLSCLCLSLLEDLFSHHTFLPYGCKRS